MEGYLLEWGRGRLRGKVQGLRSTNWQVQNRQGEVKNSIENGEAKELKCKTHGHELKEGIARENEGTGQRGAKRKNLGQL